MNNDERIEILAKIIERAQEEILGWTKILGDAANVMQKLLNKKVATLEEQKTKQGGAK